MFDLLILTLEDTLFSGPVRSILIPGVEGYFQVLPNHAPLVALVKCGRVEISYEESKEVYAISGGFFEFAHNQATLIADAFEKASEIDYNRAVASLEKANERLSSSNNSIELESIKQAIKRAENRIRIYNSLKSL